MAHSLFEPMPKPIRETLWQRMRELNAAIIAHDEDTGHHSDPALIEQASVLDARGRQQLLQAVLTMKPLTK